MVDSRYVRLATDVREATASVADFPKSGIDFKDITTVLKRGDLYAGIAEWLLERARSYGPIDKVVAVESRGYWFGCPLAVQLGAGFVPIRKPDKLPRLTTFAVSVKEYGQDVLHIHKGDIVPGESVLLVDDLLATGGTVETSARLVEAERGILKAVLTPVELRFLNGRERIRYPLESLVVYE